MSGHVCIDYETFYSTKLKYTLKLQIAEQYVKHHLFDPYIIAASDGSSCWAGSIKDFNWNALEGKTVVAHNGYFEKTCTAELERREWIPKVSQLVKEWHCTANLTSYLCNRRSLDMAIEHLFGIRVDKTARADSNNKRWPNDYTAQQQKDMLSYAKYDCHYGWLLWEKYAHMWPALERRISSLTIEQGRSGVQINRELLDNYILWSHEMKMNTENEIPWIRDSEDEEWAEFSDKPTSTKNIAEQCRRSGIPCPPVKSDDEEAFEEWESTYGPNNKWIYALSAWRSINKLYKTFLTVKERLRPDNTLPFALKYFGAHTGRWSGDARVNMQNMRRLPIFCNEHGLLETSEKREIEAVITKKKTGKWPEWVRYSIDFRHLIVPRPGKKMIVSDLSQIEPRVLAWCCGDWDMLNQLRGGMSVYEAHARVTMGWTGGVLKKEDDNKYKLAKARVLALGYQAGWEKFIKMAMTLAGLDITTTDPEWEEVDNPFTGKTERFSGFGKESKRIVAEFRTQNPKIVGLWSKLDGAFKQSVGSDFIMTLPSGRKMQYLKVRGETRIEQDPKTKQPRRKSVFTADADGRRKQYYGGKLTENLVQATARDIFAEHIIGMEGDARLCNLFGVHDEAVLEVDQDVQAADVEAYMSKCPEWIAGLPVGAEAHEVPHYLK